nr:WD40 repeat domain-containing protein [Mangrovitalea sediminis]
MHHRGPIAGIASHGNLIATAGYCNTVILWDADRRQALARGNHDHLVNQCAFNQSGTLLLSASSDYTARLWDVPSMRLKAVLGGHEDDVDMAAFSPDDRLIATCALDRKVRIFTVDGHCLFSLAGHTGNVLSLAWSQDSRRLVSSSVDGTLREWSVEEGRALQTHHLGMRTDSVVIDRRGRIWAGDDDGRIVRVLDGAMRCWPAHRAGIKKLVLHPAGTHLLTLSYDRFIGVWRIHDNGEPEEICRHPCPASIWVRAATFLDDRRVAVGTFGGTYAVLDWQTAQWDLTGVAAGKALNGITVAGPHIYSVGDAGMVLRDGLPQAAMGSLCNFITHSGTRLFCGGLLGTLFDGHTGEALYQHHSPLNCGTLFVRDRHRYLAVGTYTGELLVFQLNDDDGSLQPVQQTKAYANAVKSVAANGCHLFSVGASGDVCWHDVQTLQPVRQQHKAHTRIANACCAIGERGFASVGRDRTLRLWCGDEEATYATPHAFSVKAIAIDTGQRFLMTGSYGGTLAAFDLQQRCWLPLQRPTASGIAAIDWNPNRSHFVAAAYDGNVHEISL